MKITEEELNNYRTAVWNLLVSIEQGWVNYKQKISELKQIDKQLFDNTNITSAMHSDSEGHAILEDVKYTLEYVEEDVIKLTRCR